MPYVSKAQVTAKGAHTQDAGQKRSLLEKTPRGVKEWDAASRGLKLPARKGSKGVHRGIEETARKIILWTP